MKLNPDCIRTVLLVLEERLQITTELRTVPVTITDLFETLPQYKEPDILYTAEKLSEAGYIKAAFQYAGGRFADGSVSAITCTGHEYLENIRSARAWQEVKKALTKAGTFSLSVAFEAAKAVALKMLDEALH